MIERRKIALLCVLLPLAAVLSAQPYERIERRNFWNAGANAAGLRTDSVTVSYAELYGRSTQGEFRDTYQAREAWSAGAVAKTIAHRERYSMAGAFSFDHTSGREMCGSMFIRPGFYPVDVLEFTPGRKDLQTYSFTGGIAADAAPRWRLGGKMEFLAANCAKRKDLRHTNYRLEMKVAPGVMYHKGRTALGLAYVFGKNSESVRAEEVGSTVGTYYAFLDKGLMYGAYEDWEGSGVHLKESGVDGFPVKETMHGVSVQVQQGGLYVDAEYLRSVGSAGEKQTVWFEFSAHRVSSHVGYRFRRGEVWHYLRAEFSWSRQVNDENVLGRETAGGVTVTRVYGSNRIFERRLLRVNPEYEAVFPKGEVRLGAEVSSLRRLATQMFPYGTLQTMTLYRGYVCGERRVGRFDLKGYAAFASGSRTERELEAATETEPGDPPYRLTEYLDWQDEYLSASRVSVGVGVRYRIPRGVYAELGATFVHGFGLRFVGGANRWAETLKVGYVF